MIGCNTRMSETWKKELKKNSYPNVNTNHRLCPNNWKDHEYFIELENCWNNALVFISRCRFELPTFSFSMAMTVSYITLFDRSKKKRNRKLMQKWSSRFKHIPIKCLYLQELVDHLKTYSKMRWMEWDGMCCAVRFIV